MTTKTTTFATNDVLTANDLNALAGAWNSYTPTLAQGASTDIAKTVTYAKYLQFGKLIICQIKLVSTAAGTAGSAVSVSLPVTAATSDIIVGSGSFYDTSASASYPGGAYLESTTKVTVSNTSNDRVGSAPNLAVASGDIVFFAIIYEAA